MGYDAKTIAPQLRRASAKGLRIIQVQWEDSPEMTWLINREAAFRARWPDESDPSPLRAQELAALLTCTRTRADFCEWADTPPCQSCTDCPYAGGDFSLVLPAWHDYQGEREKEFYDVRTRDGQEYLRCWPNADRFHAKTGHVIDEKEVTHYRLSISGLIATV